MDLVDKEELNIKETKDSVLILDNCTLNIVKNKFSELLNYSLSDCAPLKIHVNYCYRFEKQIFKICITIKIN